MQDSPPDLISPLRLPCGAVLPNRLAKAAMTEGLADRRNRATPLHATLYRRWSHGGAGLLVTGNVQVDRRHLERPGNVAIAGPQDATAMAALVSWARAGTEAGNHLWMQISHAGRQTPRMVNRRPRAPSAVPLALPGGQFGRPVALEETEIEALVDRFGESAAMAREAGFTGVQIHAAHGYLISSFLSPLTNRREDGWGGDLAGRARFLLQVVSRTRQAIGPDFPLSVKLNAADFQKGGFGLDDSRIVARWLDEAGVDLIEVSGGTYEQPSMIGLDGLEPADEPAMAPSTQRREAYFARFAPSIRAGLTRARLMVTGGFRGSQVMREVLSAGSVDVIGLGRPLCVDTDAPLRLLAGDLETLERWEQRLRLAPGWLGSSASSDIVRMLNAFGVQSWYYEQLVRLGEGREAHRGLPVIRAFLRSQWRDRWAAWSLAS